MTTEEKARAYDEAIEKIKYVMEHGVSPVLNKEDLQGIFPELAESEDDRIRKALIEYFKRYREIGTCGSETFSGIPTDNILAWLEKQGQKPTLRERYENIAQSEWFKRTHERMSVSDEESKWTEEDEERLQSCISSLQGKGLMGGVDTINTKWLKSLKQRMEEQQ